MFYYPEEEEDSQVKFTLVSPHFPPSLSRHTQTHTYTHTKWLKKQPKNDRTNEQMKESSDQNQNR